MFFFNSGENGFYFLSAGDIFVTIRDLSSPVNQKTKTTSSMPETIKTATDVHQANTVHVSRAARGFPPSGSRVIDGAAGGKQLENYWYIYVFLFVFAYFFTTLGG